MRSSARRPPTIAASSRARRHEEMRDAVANSKTVDAHVLGKTARSFCSSAARHQRRHRVAHVKVGRLPGAGRRLRECGRFDQLEARRVVLLLDDVEARDARLAHALARVGQRRLAEAWTPRDDANVDVAMAWSVSRVGARYSYTP